MGEKAFTLSGVYYLGAKRFQLLDKSMTGHHAITSCDFSILADICLRVNDDANICSVKLRLDRVCGWGAHHLHPSTNPAEANQLNDEERAQGPPAGC